MCRHCKMDDVWLGWEMRLFRLDTRAMEAGAHVSPEDALRQVPPGHPVTNCKCHGEVPAKLFVFQTTLAPPWVRRHSLAHLTALLVYSCGAHFGQGKQLHRSGGKSAHS